MRINTVITTAVLAVFALAAILPGVLAPFPPDLPDPLATLQTPSAAHVLGTDYLGRDQLSRIVFGARETLIGAGIAVLVGLAGGLLLGILAALLGKQGDSAVSRVIDVLLSVPTLLIAIVIVAVLGFGVQPPTAEGGSMIAAGSTYLMSGRWWLVVFPTLAIAALVLSLNALGRKLGRLQEGAL